MAIGSGTVATTARWPYYGSGRPGSKRTGKATSSTWTGGPSDSTESSDEVTDRGVSQGIGGTGVAGTARIQGTMSLNAESWGVASNATAIPSGSYDVELNFYVPVAYEQKMLTGAVFCQTLSTTLELDLDWANLSDLFTLTGNAAVDLHSDRHH